MSPPCSSYYDIDEILAQEELIPVTNKLDFAYLAHLDPEYTHCNAAGHTAGKMTKHYLAQGTKFKMPLWSIQTWAETGLIHLQLPKHYGKRARERLDVDPVSVDLRKRNERYYRSGMAIIRLFHRIPNPEKEHHRQEADHLKKSLLKSYTGARLRRILDWTLSSIEDDVSHYTKRLSQMELALFQRGAQASHAHSLWKCYGTRRIHVSETALRMSAMDHEGIRGGGGGDSSRKSYATPLDPKMKMGQGAAKVSPEQRRDGVDSSSMQRANKRLRGFY